MAQTDDNGRPEPPPQEHKMFSFIQALYGTVLGASFILGFSAVSSNTAGAASSTVLFTFKTIAVSENTVLCFLLYMISVTIVAHNWYSFHSEKKHPDKFSKFIPEILSMLFLSQMVYAGTQGDLIYWFGAALLYTFCNITDHIMKGDICKTYPKYILHLILCLCGLIFIPESVCFGVALTVELILLLALIGLWSFEESLTKGIKVKLKSFFKKRKVKSAPTVDS